MAKFRPPYRPRQGHGAARRRPPPGARADAGGNRVWIYGVHPVLAALANPDRTCHRLYATAEVAERLGPRLAAASGGRGGAPRPEIVTRSQLDALLPGAVHQGIAAAADPLPEMFLEDLIVRAENRPTLLLVMLDQVTDPHNVGAILRSAAAFGADGVITTQRHAPGETAALAKSAAGALDLVPFIRVQNLARAMEDLKQAGVRCIGLDASADIALDALAPAARRALVLGGEGTGLRRLTRDTCDTLVRISLAPVNRREGAMLDSLNVSNAAAVALYALSHAKA